MERNSATNCEVEQGDIRSRTLGAVARRFTATLRRVSSVRPEGMSEVVVYQGSGAPLLPDGHGISSKEQSDAVVDKLLGRV